VSWSLRTTPSQATGFTPFFMVHSFEEVLLTDIDYNSPWVRAYTEEGNQVALRTRSTNSTRRVMWHYCGVLSTSRHCGVTTSATCARASSMSATSFSDGFKAARTGTSCRHLGRGFHHPSGAPTRDVQDLVRGREGRHQHMEHRKPRLSYLPNLSNSWGLRTDGCA
jgi:hypothetical protein